MEKTRIVEMTDNEYGRTLFYPQKRNIFGIWKYLEYDEGIMKFNTLEDARKYFPSKQMLTERPPKNPRFTTIVHY